MTDPDSWLGSTSKFLQVPPGDSLKVPRDVQPKLLAPHKGGRDSQKFRSGATDSRNFGRAPKNREVRL